MCSVVQTLQAFERVVMESWYVSSECRFSHSADCGGPESTRGVGRWLLVAIGMMRVRCGMMDCQVTYYQRCCQPVATDVSEDGIQHARHARHHTVLPARYAPSHCARRFGGREARQGKERNYTARASGSEGGERWPPAKERRIKIGLMGLRRELDVDAKTTSDALDAFRASLRQCSWSPSSSSLSSSSSSSPPPRRPCSVRARPSAPLLLLSICLSCLHRSPVRLPSSPSFVSLRPCGNNLLLSSQHYSFYGQLKSAPPTSRSPMARLPRAMISKCHGPVRRSFCLPSRV